METRPCIASGVGDQLFPYGVGSIFSIWPRFLKNINGPKES